MFAVHLVQHCEALVSDKNAGRCFMGGIRWAASAKYINKPKNKSAKANH